jgi:hypothetical protein
MTRLAYQLAMIAAACLLSLAGSAQPAGRVIAQENPPAVSAAQSQAWADEAARMAVAEAQSYDIRLGSADGPRLKLADKPALKWSNTEDATIHGSILVWMHAGRPEAVASIFKFFTAKDEFSAELHSLSEGPLVAAKGRQTVWQPAEAGVTFAPLPKVAAPAKSAPARLSQMRGIARDFTGTMTTFDQTTHPLRLLSQPLVRYAGDEKHPVDGAMFAFARATDPDVLLLLETRAKAEAEPQWHYALARMHCGALAMSYDDREIWSRDQMEHPFARPTGAYTLFQDLPEPTLSPVP